ncbi:MAG: hypothetical protein LKE20_05100 [Limosilactobacillus oris]|jgi:mannose/fructose/N-acetylgalactosamine-specific phosphotransferase system component IIC|uniref:hypothetical protein n=1 Tax=Limosilactobacillus oris TaxID=1632 RepID=UPI00242CE3C8|nr:hypothetical protein [Limosilactobacillus oris]MCH3911488.1 hypothetical protein [Limosilactobacillus oris]MCH3938738.1 hypothetical protein [Limosilactobacillus oris]MCI1980134.1 hypothetical protein [Limosilactobacillus oris]MCI2042892.1 hypothetical protein [Limosilactobacillus oris]
MIFLVIFISSIIAFFLRILDIFITFLENGIKLSFLESVITFLILLKVFKNAIKTCIKNKNWKGIKTILILYLFEFQTFLIFISSFIYETAKATGVKVSGKLYDKKSVKDLTRNKDILLLMNAIKEAIKAFGSKHPKFSFD